MTLQQAIAMIKLYEEGRYKATLEEGIAWEALGLGRIRFHSGRPTFVR